MKTESAAFIQNIARPEAATVLCTAAMLGLISGFAWSHTGVLAQEPVADLGARLTALLVGGGGIAGALARLFRSRYLAWKRFVDIVGASAGLLLSFPLLALAVLAVKLTSPGPAIFSQERVGKDGRIFLIYKLRTMVPDAERETGPVWASKDDPRVTPVGRFLRKTRLDEIPQFVNVLKGEMSLIGPRPERPEIVQRLTRVIPEYELRLTVKPGITGLAQVRAQYDETIEDVRRKVKLDLLYIRELCVATDMRILLRTFRVVLTGQGAR